MDAETAHADRPYLTAELPGVAGRYKQRPDDFRVEEVPLYMPGGTGTHLYFRVTKTGVSTPEAVARIARHLGVRPGEIGFAGLKDARAVTRQMMSLEHADAARLGAFADPRIGVEPVGHHGNKLRTGHLAGNRFTIRLRGVGAEDLPAARAVLDILQRRGVPNYFGRQRFGARGDTAALGEALVRGDLEQFVALLLGQPCAADGDDVRAARDAFDTGHYARALDLWPRAFREHRKALAAYKKRSSPKAALAAVDKRTRRLYVSAFQSAIFNDVLARRIDTFDRVRIGDLAKKAGSGGVFRVEDADAEQPRAARFEISPTGPVPGYRSRLADGQPGRIERDVLQEHEIAPEDFRGLGALKPKGTRRPLRFGLGDPELSAGTDADGDYLELRFTAPPGSYATVVLREIVKGE
ncbi:MAG: tRNA pseudouridine(13) synthase TruD [Phycisphaerae bacterium]|nr:tRNA pseudouridine(13) synthase TruD [Phycisphaerae bacterium]